VHEGVDDRFRSPPGGVLPFGLEVGGYWLTLGGIVARKGLDTAIRALARVRGDLPLVVAGPAGDAARALRGVAAESGMLDRVRFVGFVPDEHLPDLVAGARALLHPSLDEGFGLVPLEAMAAGTPVLAARTGAIPEVVGDAAWLLDTVDVGAWAEALDALARDERLVSDLTARGRARASSFTWGATVARTEEVYAACSSR
jgi:glycosyltransferase involved in cell wall biosynthesis